MLSGGWDRMPILSFVGYDANLSLPDRIGILSHNAA